MNTTKRTDRDGKVLNVGDKVVVPAVVTEIYGDMPVVAVLVGGRHRAFRSEECVKLSKRKTVTK